VDQTRAPSPERLAAAFDHGRVGQDKARGRERALDHPSPLRLARNFVDISAMDRDDDWHGRPGPPHRVGWWCGVVRVDEVEWEGAPQSPQRQHE
jgi:hypothetical protein